MIEEEKKAALFRLHRRGLLNKAVKEEPLLVPHARINYFFSLKKIDAPNLPDDVPSILPELDAVVDQLPVEPVSIVTEKNVIDFIQYMLRRNRRYIEDSFQACCGGTSESLAAALAAAAIGSPRERRDECQPRRRRRNCRLRRWVSAGDAV